VWDLFLAIVGILFGLLNSAVGFTWCLIMKPFEAERSVCTFSEHPPLVAWLGGWFRRQLIFGCRKMRVEELVADAGAGLAPVLVEVVVALVLADAHAHAHGGVRSLEVAPNQRNGIENRINFET
jgi:hypothetical protein